VQPVEPSNLATQPVGEAARVAEGVYQLKLPVPLPLVFVSVYLIEGDNGWTIVDAGYEYPKTYEVWESGARSIGLDLSEDVARIVVTHFHPDHIGAARWLQERTGAPVYMLEEEIPNARHVWESERNSDLFTGDMIRHGMPREMAEKAASGNRSGLRLPDDMRPLSAGEKLDVGGSAVRVIHAPGHAEYQLMLHDERRGILYAADHLLLKITPNVGLWPESRPRPLARYLDSITGLRSLDASLILPGHGPVFHDLAGRIDELLAHHDERLDAMLATLSDGPLTPYEVSRIVFRGGLSGYQKVFALAETLAHLEHLETQGRARRSEDGVVRYGAADGSARERAV
jgi:glyoxylase-like metal-dependent hydrolase (beta-lactamase superfamily II)